MEKNDNISSENLSEGNIKETENVEAVETADGKCEATEQEAEKSEATEQEEEKNDNNSTKKRNLLLTIALILIIVAGIGVTIYSLIPKGTYNGEKWFDTDVDINTEIERIEAFDTKKAVSSISDHWVYNNIDSPVNDDTYYYVSKASDDRKLYKINKNTFENIKIADIPGYPLGMIEGKLYYWDVYSDSDDENGIYCINIDGSDKECVIQGDFGSVNIVNEWIYYTNRFNHKLYKMHYFNRKPIVLYGDYCDGFDVYENTIYLGSYDKENDIESFCTMDVDGKGFEVLAENIDCYSWRYSEGFVYYTIADKSLNRLDVNTLETETLYEGTISNFTVSGNEVFYVDTTRDYILASFDIEKRESSDFNLCKVSDYAIYEDYMFIYYVDDNLKPAVTVNDRKTGKAVSFFD